MLEHGERMAVKILREGLFRARLRESDLSKLRATDQRKVEIAREIWARTTVSQSWIADHLKMRNAANVSLSLHRLSAKLRASRVSKVKENAH